MRGEVLHYDEAQGFGFITGSDGNQYTVAREDFRQAMPKTKGTLVEFQPSAGQAKLIRAPQEAASSIGDVPANSDPAAAAAPPAFTEPTLLDPLPPKPAQAPASAPWPASAVPETPQPRALPRSAIAPRPATVPRSRPPSHYPAAPDAWADNSIWDYFWRGLTENYVNFDGRARRKEYWGFALFATIVFVALLVIGLVIDLTAWDFSWNDPTLVFCWSLPGLWTLATILPGIAVTVRRQHDIGISGWFYLLVLIPSVGWLIILVFALIPSQKHDNKWGPVPTGVRLSAYDAPSMAR